MNKHNKCHRDNNKNKCKLLHNQLMNKNKLNK